MRAENLDGCSHLKTPPRSTGVTWQNSHTHAIFPPLPLTEGGRRMYSCSHTRVSEFIVGSSNKARPPLPTVSQYYHLESHMRQCNLRIVSSTVSEMVKTLAPLQLESPCWFYFTCPFACGSAANVPLWDRTHSLPTSF